MTSSSSSSISSFRELQHINVPVMLMPDDFRAFSKIKIDNHAFNKENLPSHFKVKNIEYLCSTWIRKGVKDCNSFSSGERVLSACVPQLERKVSCRSKINQFSNSSIVRFCIDDLDFLNSLSKSPKPIDPIKVFT